jgi:hypothetical protein
MYVEEDSYWYHKHIGIRERMGSGSWRDIRIEDVSIGQLMGGKK